METATAVSGPQIAPPQICQPRSRWTSGRPAKILRQVGATILVAILLVVFVGLEKSYDAPAVLHYYLAAKYFSEIGYFNLHTCALEADDDAGGYWYGINGARDMETYRIVLRSSLPPCPRTNFTAERWSEFSQDVEYFASHTPPIYFASSFADKGFNPPPSWVAVAKPVAKAVPISNSLVADIVFNLDIIAVLIGLLMIWRSCSGIAALLTAALTIFYFGNFGRIGGNFLQYLWFPLLVVAIVLWAKDRPGLSGAVLGVAVGLQIFPLFFGLPIVVRGIIEFLRHRKESDWRPHFRFSGTLISVILAGFLLGNLAGRGGGVWGEWQKKISIHTKYLKGEIFDIGLANLTASTVSANHNDSANYVDDVPNTFMRLDSLQRNIWIYRASCTIFLAMWVLIVVRAHRTDLFGHGYLIMYATACSSPYYYLTLALVPFMFWKSGRILRLYATWGTVALFVANAILFRGHVSITFQYLPHLLSGYSIAIFLFGLAVTAIFTYFPYQISPEPKALAKAAGAD